MVKLGHYANRPIDRFRLGLLQVILYRLRALNENTRMLLRLLEEPNWSDLGARALRHVRKRIID